MVHLASALSGLPLTGFLDGLGEYGILLDSVNIWCLRFRHLYLIHTYIHTYIYILHIHILIHHDMINEQMSHRLATAVGYVTSRNWPLSQHHQLYNKEHPRKKIEKGKGNIAKQDRGKCERAGENIYLRKAKKLFGLFSTFR